MANQVSNIFHTTHLVDDLPAAREWFGRVFARRTISWADRWDLSAVHSDYPVDYSFMVLIGDLVHDALCPSMYRPPKSNSVLWDDVTSGLAGISWWLKGSREFSQAMAENGIRLRDQSGNLVKGGEFGSNLIVPEMSMMTTSAEDAGFAHSFTELLPPHLERYQTALPRLSPHWRPSPVEPNDPLQIDRVAFHTLLTSQPERSIRFMTRDLGGMVAHRTSAGSQGTESVFVFYADTMLEFALLPNTWQVFDQYHQITLRTADLNQTRTHLTKCGIPLIEDGPNLIVTDPKHCLHMRWGFTTNFIEGDPRAGA